MRAKVARRFQVTIPETVRRQTRLSVGDTVDVRSEGDRIIIERLEANWEAVMRETGGRWREHPIFGQMKNSVEIVRWLRSKE